MSIKIHQPFTDDGVTYCGWDGHEGCGEVWPCSTIRAQGLREQATSETDASARPIPPDVLNGLTSAAYSDVIRREADEASYARSDPARFNTYLDAIMDSEDWVKFSSRRRIAEAVMALADAEMAEVSEIITTATLDTIVRLTMERDDLTDKVARFDRERQGFKAAIAQRDATIETLTAEAERLSNLLHLTLDERNARDAEIESLARGNIRILNMLAERNATIVRLWRQLNEATNVPDKTAALSEPDEGEDFATMAALMADAKRVQSQSPDLRQL